MTAEPSPGTFRVLTYNVLAPTFTVPKYFPSVSAEAMDKERRYALTVDRLVTCGADLICLQEIEADLWELLSQRLAALGYWGQWATRSDLKPDGCATFWRTSMFTCECRIFRYKEMPGLKLAHRMALISVLQPIHARDRGAFTVVNTHLAWEQPVLPTDVHLGLIEAHQLAALLGRPTGPLIVCGDFNAEPDSPILHFFHEIGLTESHGDNLPTSCPRGHAKKIDYLMATSDFEAIPLPIEARLTDGMILPSLSEPSDHLPLATDFLLKR
jgi:endonuclease/exonuclease/phosphatase family metal-dependent hydrolase